MVIDLYIKGKDNTIIVCTEDGKLVDKDAPNRTNNQCEWDAVNEALILISGWDNKDEFNIHIDSKLIISQLLGKVPSDYIEPFEDCRSQRIKSKNLKEFYFKWNRLYNLIKRDIIINYKYLEPDNNIARKWLR